MVRNFQEKSLLTLVKVWLLVVFILLAAVNTYLIIAPSPFFLDLFQLVELPDKFRYLIWGGASLNFIIMFLFEKTVTVYLLKSDVDV